MTITLTREEAEQVLDTMGKAISFKESDTLWSLEFLQSVMRLGNDLRARLNAPEPEPFGIWHQGDTYEESDFYLYKDFGDVACKTCVKLYRAPPQREWQGLTEEDFSAINQSCSTKIQAAVSTESILREKNT